MPAPSRAGGDCSVRRRIQLALRLSHAHVLFWSTPLLPPPNRTTACMRGLKAAEPAYTQVGCIRGDCRVHVAPSYVQVLIGLKSPRPPNITTSPVIGFAATAAMERPYGTVGGNNCVQSEPVHCHIVGG